MIQSLDLFEKIDAFFLLKLLSWGDIILKLLDTPIEKNFPESEGKKIQKGENR